MPKSSQDPHTETSSNSDGEYDRIISDPNTELGKQVGVVAETKNAQHPYHVTKLEHHDKDLEKFQRMMKGRKMEEE